MTPVLECSNITKWFGSTKALSDVSFQIEPGRVAVGYSMYSSDNYAFNFFPYMWYVFLFSVAISIGFYMITDYIFKKKLNLE